MPYLDAYLQNIIDRGNLKLAESVKETAENDVYPKNWTHIN